MDAPLRSARLDDNAALCALARRCPQGRRIRFFHERDDFRERCRQHAAADVFVIERDAQIVGAAAVARKPMWLGGDWRSTAYIFDLMVDPAHRGRGLARRLLDAAWRSCPGVRLHYAYILEDNVASRRLFESAGFEAYPRRLFYHAILIRGRRAVAADLEWHQPIPAADAAHLDSVLRSRYDFLDASSGHEGLFHLVRNGSSAWAALRRYGPKVFTDVPWYLAGLSRLLPFLPRPGRLVRAWSLHHLHAEGPHAKTVLADLVTAVCHRAAEEGVAVVMLPLFEDDPCMVHIVPLTLSRWGLRLGTTRLYVAGEFNPTRPLLASGRDG